MTPGTKRMLPFPLTCFPGLQACYQEAENTDNSLAENTDPVSGQAANEIPYGQLPRGVMPTRYELMLKIFPEKDNFSGKTTIDMKIDLPKDHFYIHGKNLKATRFQKNLERTLLRIPEPGWASNHHDKSYRLTTVHH